MLTMNEIFYSTNSKYYYNMWGELHSEDTQYTYREAVIQAPWMLDDFKMNRVAKSFVKKMKALNSVEERLVYFNKYAKKYVLKEDELDSDKKAKLEIKKDISSINKYNSGQKAKALLESLENEIYSLTESGEIVWSNVSLDTKNGMAIESRNTMYEGAKITFSKERDRVQDKIWFLLRVSFQGEIVEKHIRSLGKLWKSI